MRLFAQSLSGEAKKWYRDLPARSISTFEAFRTAFLERWDDKKSPLQVLCQYNSLKKGGFEYVHEFSSRFMRVYNSIPADIKPLVGTAKLHYVDDSFDNDFALLLRERKSMSLPVVFKDALELEANMMASGNINQKVEIDKRKVREESVPSTSAASSPNDVKLKIMIKTMEILMDMMIVDNIPLNR